MRLILLFTPTTPLLPQASPSFVHYRFSSSGAAPHAHPATQSCKPVSPCSRSALWAPSTRRTCWSRCENWNDFSSPVVRGQQPEQMTAASSGECCCLIQKTSAKGALRRFACYRWILVRANDSRNSPSDTLFVLFWLLGGTPTEPSRPSGCRRDVVVVRLGDSLRRRGRYRL